MHISKRILILAGIAILGIILLCTPFSTSEARESITLEQDKTVEKMFAVGKDIYVYGTVEESAVSVGGDIHVFGTVEENAVAIRGNVFVETGGKVDESAVSLGKDVTVQNEGSVGGNAVTIGGSLHLDPGGTVEGDMVDVSAFSNPMMQGFRNGASGVCRTILLGPFFGAFGAFGAVIGLIIIIAKLLVSLAIVFLMVSLFRSNVDAIALQIRGHFVRSLLAGLLILILVPFIIVGLLITIIGIPLIPVFIIVCFIGYLLGSAGVALWAGQLLPGAGTRSSLRNAIIGVLLIALVKLAPGAGLLIAIISALLSFGALFITMSGGNKSAA
jgi:hypothetical protein